MIIRCMKRHFKKRFAQLVSRVHMSPEELVYYEELFCHKKYKPHTFTDSYKSFNTVFRDWLFQQRPFCEAFIIFICIWPSLIIQNNKGAL